MENRGPSDMVATDIIILWEEYMNNKFQGEPLGECVENAQPMPTAILARKVAG